MALCRTVGLTLKITKPVLANPCFVIPSSVNVQVRHAARKGYREKANQKRKQEKLEKIVVPKEFSKIRSKFVKFEKTVALDKPEPPDDDVIIRSNFNYKKYSLAEIIGFHREYHHPTVHNNPNAPIFVRIEIHMVGKRETQFMKPFSGVAAIPHPFVVKHKKEVLVLCPPEQRELALKCGASVAGDMDVIKKIQEGLIQPSLYDYVISPTPFLSNLTPIRNLLKDQLPRAKLGTLTNDLEAAIHRFLHGIEYTCVKYGGVNDFGVIHCALGTLGMEVEQVEENFKALLNDIETKRPPRGGPFITWAWCTSPPSNEEFPVELSLYLQTQVFDDDDDDDVPELSDSSQERAQTQKLLQEYEEKEMLN